MAIAVWIAVVVSLIHVYVDMRMPTKILRPGLVRHPSSIQVEIPERREPREDLQPLVPDRYVDQMEGSEPTQPDERRTDLGTG